MISLSHTVKCKLILAQPRLKEIARAQSMGWCLQQLDSLWPTAWFNSQIQWLKIHLSGSQQVVQRLKHWTPYGLLRGSSPRCNGLKDTLLGTCVHVPKITRRGLRRRDCSFGMEILLSKVFPPLSFSLSLSSLSGKCAHPMANRETDKELEGHLNRMKNQDFWTYFQNWVFIYSEFVRIIIL